MVSVRRFTASFTPSSPRPVSHAPSTRTLTTHKNKLRSTQCSPSMTRHVHTNALLRSSLCYSLVIWKRGGKKRTAASSNISTISDKVSWFFNRPFACPVIRLSAYYFVSTHPFSFTSLCCYSAMRNKMNVSSLIKVLQMNMTRAHA